MRGSTRKKEQLMHTGCAHRLCRNGDRPSAMQDMLGLVKDCLRAACVRLQASANVDIIVEERPKAIVSEKRREEALRRTLYQADRQQICWKG